MISLDRSLENDNVSKIMETNTVSRGRAGRGLWGLINSTGARLTLLHWEVRMSAVEILRDWDCWNTRPGWQLAWNCISDQLTGHNIEMDFPPTFTAALFHSVPNRSKPRDVEMWLWPECSWYLDYQTACRRYKIEPHLTTVSVSHLPAHWLPSPSEM